MKNLVLFLLSGIVLFGGQLQQAAPLMAKFKDATPKEYSVHKSAQITLNVPIDIDEIPVGTTVGKNNDIVEGYRLTCAVHHNHQGYYYAIKDILGGNKTITLKFNGIPMDRVFSLNRYGCFIYVRAGGKSYFLSVLPDIVVDNTSHEVSGFL